MSMHFDIFSMISQAGSEQCALRRYRSDRTSAYMIRSRCTHSVIYTSLYRISSPAIDHANQAIAKTIYFHSLQYFPANYPSLFRAFPTCHCHAILLRTNYYLFLFPLRVVFVSLEYVLVSQKSHAPSLAEMETSLDSKKRRK